MSYIRPSFLRQQAFDQSKERTASILEERVSPTFSRAKRIFLSHSHKDKELARGFRNFLLSLGIELYLDWLDSSMPPEPNRETAEKIKVRISACQHILVLATNNALESKWVPWEIGVADASKGTGSITLIPVVEDYEYYRGSEYMQLYRHIEVAETGYAAVFEVNMSRGKYLDAWLRNL